MVALPVIHDNTPAAGYVSWDAFSVVYAGTAYGVGASNSNMRWVWWQWNDGAPSLEDDDYLPPDPRCKPEHTVLHDEDLVLIGNKQGTGMRIQSATFLDGELIVDGTIFAKKVDTQAIKTGELVADSAVITKLNSTLLTGSTLQTRGDSERGVKIGTVGDAEGIFVYADTGIPFLKAVPAEGMAVIAGEVKATTETVTQGSSLGGITEITRAEDGNPGALRLTAYTTAPKSAPTATTGYDTVQFATTAGAWSDRMGLDFDGTNWFTTWQSPLDGVLYLEKWNSTGTTRLASIGVSSGSNIHGVGVACYGTDVFVLDYSAGTYYLSQWRKSDLFFLNSSYWPHADGPRDPAISIDQATGEIIIAQPRQSNANKPRIRRYTIPTGSGAMTAVAGSIIDCDFAWDYDLCGVLYGTFDYGVNRYVLAAVTGGQRFKTVDTTGALDANHEWQSGMSNEKVGLVYASGAFQSIDATGIKRTYTGQDALIPISSATLTKWVSNTLINNSPRTVTVTTTNASTAITAGAGTFDTTLDVGAKITGTNIPDGTTLTAVTSATAATLSQAATAGGATSATLTRPALRTASVTTANNTTITSSGQFLTTDVGMQISSPNLLSGTTITAVANASSATISQASSTVGTTTTTIWRETDQSPRAKITMPKRSKLLVTTSPINSTGQNPPDRVRVYVGTGTTDPGRAAMAKQTDPAMGVITTSYSSLSTNLTAVPPVANGFIAAGGTVQQLQLADGTVVIDALGAGTPWTTYTPAWTAATANPVLGNGTLTGRYARIGRNTITFNIVLTAGSTTTFGTGGYAFGLPVPARNSEELVIIANQSTPNHMYIGRRDTAGVTNTFALFLTSTDGSMSAATSGLTTTSVLRISGTYEAA